MTTEIESWEDEKIQLRQELLRGIYAYGFEQPSTIQKKAIIPFINKKDIIAQSQSGTGKTGAFVIGSLQNIDVESNEPQILILAPVRELARQINNVVKNLGRMMKIRTHYLVGGTSIDEDIKILTNEKPQVIIGCPGRTYDMIRRKQLKTSGINCIIIDEADEMLSSGFKEQIYNIFQQLNANIQVCLFSATLPLELKDLSEKFLRNPIKILVQKTLLTLQGISQFYIALDNDEHKYGTLKDLFKGLSISQAIIYCNSVRRVDDLYAAMKYDKFPVEKIHGGMSEAERKTVFMEFKTGKCRVLISTDLLARGIDIQQVSIVINFDVTKNVHTYLHRIGRSGRWGRKGVGINFTTKRDFQYLKEIEKYYSTEIKEMPIDYSSYL